MYMTECNVCYSDICYEINCFEKCNFVICHNCFLNILKLNDLDCVEYCCPQCRHTSIKNNDKRFTRFINNNKKFLKKIVQLYETKFKQHTTQNVSFAWSEFNRQRNEESMPYPIISLDYFDYDSLLPDDD